jgi:predicted Zn-dependent protease with MMP-like domain
VDRARFERLVAEAVDKLPDEFHEKLANIDVVVERQPTFRQLAEAGLKSGETLLGLYEGIPQTERGRHYGLVVPDKITIFQRPIEAQCRNDVEIRSQIRGTVLHEIAHHFGIDDDRLRRLNNGKA